MSCMSQCNKKLGRFEIKRMYMDQVIRNITIKRSYSYFNWFCFLKIASENELNISFHSCEMTQRSYQDYVTSSSDVSCDSDMV